MSWRRAAALVARREVRERVRQRSFLVSTAVTLLIVAAVAVLSSVIGGGPERYALGVVGDESSEVAAVAESQAPAFDAEIEVQELSTDGQAEQELRDGELDAAIIDGRELLSEKELDPDLEQLVQTAVSETRSNALLEGAGLGETERDQALDPPPIATRSLEPVDEDDSERQGIAFAATILLYGQLITYGLWVAMGVVEEKASRVVELLLATVRPSALLAGKIVGLGLLGLGQLLLVAVVGVGLAAALGALELDATAVSAIGLVLLWFLLGYSLYACLYAVSGALVSRQEDLQSATTPLTIALVLAFFLAFPSLEDPDRTLARVASIVPISSPLVMPSRMALGDVALWEVVLAIALILAALAALIPIGARIYRFGILRMGSPVRLRDAWRSLRR